MKQTEYLNLKNKIKKINDPLVSRTFLDILERVRNLEEQVKKIQDSKPEKVPSEKNEIKSCLNCMYTAALELDTGETLYVCTCDEALSYMLDDDYCKYFKPKE